MKRPSRRRPFRHGETRIKKHYFAGTILQGREVGWYVTASDIRSLFVNYRIHGVVAQISIKTILKRTEPASSLSLQMTLNHIYVVDLFYVDALEGGWLGSKGWENPVPCPALTELRDAQASELCRLRPCPPYSALLATALFEET
jgi:hypothetical protein